MRERRGGLVVISVGLRYARPPLVQRLETDSLVARRQQFIDAPRGLFDLAATRQLIARQCICRHRPEIGALFAKRVFEQKGVGVQDFLLNLSQAERLRLSGRGVARAPPPNLRLRLLVCGLKSIQLAPCRFDLLPVTLAGEQEGKAVRLRVESIPQRALTLQQDRFDALANLS